MREWRHSNIIKSYWLKSGVVDLKKGELCSLTISGWGPYNPPSRRAIPWEVFCGRDLKLKFGCIRGIDTAPGTMHPPLQENSLGIFPWMGPPQTLHPGVNS